MRYVERQIGGSRDKYDIDDSIVWVGERGDDLVIVKETLWSVHWLFESKAPEGLQTVENGLLFASEKGCR